MPKCWFEGDDVVNVVIQSRKQDEYIPTRSSHTVGQWSQSSLFSYIPAQRVLGDLEAADVGLPD